MKWQNHRKLALALRDQGLCDCIAAKENLRESPLLVAGRTTDLAHLVVAKCHQSVEKITKGYLLWASGEFDPTRGHTPLTDALTGGAGSHREMPALINALNRVNPLVVADLKWLESMAPYPPRLSEEERGRPVSLDKIEPNSEYAFWSPSFGGLVIAAEGLQMSEHGLRAAKTLRTFLGVLSKASPHEFTRGIAEFLIDHPISIEIASNATDD